MKLDATSIELSPAQFAQLHRLISKAMEQFQIPFPTESPASLLH